MPHYNHMSHVTQSLGEVRGEREEEGRAVEGVGLMLLWQG